MDKLAAEFADQFVLAKLDCDVEQMIASQFGLRAIPTVYILQEGRPVDGFQGPQPEEAIRQILANIYLNQRIKSSASFSTISRR